MKNVVLILIASFFVFAGSTQTVFSQSVQVIRPRIASTTAPNAQSLPTPQQSPTPTTARPSASPTPTPSSSAPRVVIVPSAPSSNNSTAPQSAPKNSSAPISPAGTTTVIMPSSMPTSSTPIIATVPYPLPTTVLGLGEVRARLTEAKRFLQSRPVSTALTEADSWSPVTAIVTISAFEPKNNLVHTINLPKTTFLKVNLDSYLFTSLGKQIRLRTVRANGVNTAVMIVDQNNQAFIPLAVQYPIEKNGKFYEMAYYTSAHPALLSPEIARAGQIYSRTTLETALKNLRARGRFISPAVIAEAEKLCIVEHVDHQRFLTENRANLYNEIFTLFALNEGNTYRYAVSSAGAGGLVQMIPATYRMVRAQNPDLLLIPDFVEGMRNHVNAMQAMLLYMQSSYNDLLANETITQALADRTATDAELMAAGYNSNPARLPLYIRRGGSNWRNLIPKETRMYLQIQSSIESTITPLPAVK
jgi:hypothetical protein